MMCHKSLYIFVWMILYFFICFGLICGLQVMCLIKCLNEHWNFLWQVLLVSFFNIGFLMWFGEDSTFSFFISLVFLIDQNMNLIYNQFITIIGSTKRFCWLCHQTEEKDNVVQHCGRQHVNSYSKMNTRKAPKLVKAGKKFSNSMVLRRPMK